MSRLDLPRRFACWQLRTRSSGFALLHGDAPFVENGRFRGLPQRELILREVPRLGPDVPVMALRIDGASPPLDVLLEREADGAVLVVAGVAAVASDHQLSNALFALRLRADALRLRNGDATPQELEGLRAAREEVTRLLAAISRRRAGSRSW